MQENFYKEVISNRQTPHRYWAITENDTLLAMGGITNIEWENSIGEISLIVCPASRNKGIGKKTVALLLDQAFDQMGLNMVYGECYYCNEAGAGFWNKMVDIFKGYKTRLLNRKLWEGEHYDSLYFSFNRPL